jgi:PAS domain S-box-containing protein
MRIDDHEIRDADIFEILLENFPDIIHSIDQHGRIVFTNRKAEALLKYTRDELIGMDVRQIYADEILQQVETGFSDLKQRGDKTIPESMLKAKDGTRIPVEIRSFSIYDDDGRFLRTFSILRDIREIKDLQQSLIHAGRLAAIGELASGVAHDINNPLTVILLSNEMMLNQLQSLPGPLDEKSERVLSLARDVKRASKSIQKLADHLRNFSRGMAEQREPVDLSTSITDALFITHNKIQRARVTVTNNVARGRHFVHACPNHMEQVFVNLVGNACDAMEDRERRELVLSVEACRRDDVDYWKCDVADSGKGIPPELMNEIFQSFFTTKEKGKGTGLGLSICRGILSDHRGFVEVASDVGRGSTFSVLLPSLDPSMPTAVVA